MKHAINELKALLDTWGGQKDEGWNKDLRLAVGYLEDISQEPFNPNSFTPPHPEDDDLIHEGAIEKMQEEMYAAEYGVPDDLHEETVSLKGTELDRQLHRREEYTFEEAHKIVGDFANEMKVTPLPEDFNPEDNYAPATCFYEDNPTLKCQVERDDDSIDREPRERKVYVEDDDLGELDASKACDLSKEGGCESCQ